MPLVQNDLALRRFSPVDYGQPLTEAVVCPYSGCPFSTGDGEAMKRHQQENRHPGWGWYNDWPVEKKWICPKEVCGASFLAWDHLYRHMMVHSRPLGCPVCPFRAAKSTCLKRHMKDMGHDTATKADDSNVHWKRKRGSSVLKEQYLLSRLSDSGPNHSYPDVSEDGVLSSVSAFRPHNTGVFSHSNLTFSKTGLLKEESCMRRPALILVTLSFHVSDYIIFFLICSLVRATTSDAKPSGSASPIPDSK